MACCNSHGYRFPVRHQPVVVHILKNKEWARMQGHREDVPAENSSLVLPLSQHAHSFRLLQTTAQALQPTYPPRNPARCNTAA